MALIIPQGAEVYLVLHCIHAIIQLDPGIFVNLETNQQIFCSNWKWMVTTELIIYNVNTLAGRVQLQSKQIVLVASPPPSLQRMKMMSHH